VRLDEKAGSVCGWELVTGRWRGFDAVTLKKKTEIPLKGHPESFQLDAAGASSIC